MVMFFKNGESEKSNAPEVLLPLIPLRDIIIFPHIVVPLFVGREKSINALEYAMDNDKNIFLASQKKANTDDPKENDIYRVGTIGTILQLLRLPDGTVKVLVEGKKRAHFVEFHSTGDCFMVKAREFVESDEVTVETEALMRSVVRSFETYVKLNKKIPPELIVSVTSIESPSRLADTIMAHLAIRLSDKQQILELVDVSQRLERIYSVLQSEIEILQVEGKIKSRVKRQMEKAQKDYYLSEQMKAIQKELGEKDDFKNDIQDIEERLKNKKMSKEATKKAYQELKKLKLMSPMSAEATVVRSYIDWLLSLPWFEVTKEKHSLEEAQKILDEDHYGLKQVKERILEFLAVQSLVGKMKGPILCFVGPPGVGKTSLAKSIARATGKKFVRLSLGGMKDEAEIRGHRRTYIGSMPGKIIQSLKKSGSNNPVFLFDEVDKMGMDFRGDPASALLEVLDPEQNNTFNDHYLDVDYDLSQVMFITTANSLHNIPSPLMDRMEVIRIPGYTEIEKRHIARRFLIPKQFKTHGLSEDNILFSERAVVCIIRRYTREAGVRNLEREIASICRKVAREVVSGGKDKKIKITASSIPKHLGIPRYRYSRAEEKDEIGVTTGLAWTEFGGELLSTEVTVMPGKGKLILTGKLGEVMQESAQAAMSYVRSRAEALGLEKDFYQKLDLHIHVPEGAIPKDGPSAGLAMATSIVSALTKIPVRKDVVMTGEITLRGKALPIGGLKEKLLAAHRANIPNVLIPKDNEKDLKDIPYIVLKKLKVTLVEHMDDVLKNALLVEKTDNIFSKKFIEREKKKFFDKEEVTRGTTH